MLIENARLVLLLGLCHSYRALKCCTDDYQVNLRRSQKHLLGVLYIVQCSSQPPKQALIVTKHRQSSGPWLRGSVSQSLIKGGWSDCCGLMDLGWKRWQEEQPEAISTGTSLLTRVGDREKMAKACKCWCPTCCMKDFPQRHKAKKSPQKRNKSQRYWWHFLMAKGSLKTEYHLSQLSKTAHSDLKLTCPNYASLDSYKCTQTHLLTSNGQADILESIEYKAQLIR